MTGHVTFGGQCGECSSCGKCRKMLECNNIVIKEDSKETKTMEQDQSRKLYTFIIYSENVPGVLSQITAVYTRRQVNIESLNVCASSTPGAHKYTITAYCEESMAKMLTAQIEKKIDVLQANFFVDDDIYINETCLIKISSPIMLENRNINKMVRLHGAHIVEVNPTFAIIEKTGMTDEILSLYNSLQQLGCILQFVRSGRIAINKSYTEMLDKYLAEREARRKKN